MPDYIETIAAGKLVESEVQSEIDYASYAYRQKMRRYVEQLLVNELVTLKLMLESVDHDLNQASQDAKGDQIDTEWGRDLKFQLKNKIMAHYLKIFEEQEAILNQLEAKISQNETNYMIMDWVAAVVKPYKEITSQIKSEIELSLKNAKIVFGQFDFAPSIASTNQTFKAKNYCTYLGDFNGDGITDFAMVRCMAPYVKFPDEDNQSSPAVVLCFNNKHSKKRALERGEDVGEQCVLNSGNLGQDSDGIQMNRMPDMNRDGLTDFVTFNKLNAVHVHLNEYDFSSQG